MGSLTVMDSLAAIIVGVGTSIGILLAGWIGRQLRKQFRAIREGLEFNIDLGRKQLEIGDAVKSLQIEMNNRLERQNGNLRSHDTKLVEMDNRIAHLEGMVDGLMRGIQEGKSLREADGKA